MKSAQAVEVVDELLAGMRRGSTFHTKKIYDAVMARHPPDTIVDHLRLFSTVMDYLHETCPSLGNGFFSVPAQVRSGARAD